MALFDQLADRVSATIWNLHPQRAVLLGKHEYDGQVPDVSAPAVAAGLDRLGRLRAQVTALEGLTSGRELDRTALLAAVDAEVFEAGTARRWHRDPGQYVAVLDIHTYLERDYAPAGLRLERAATVLAGAGPVLAAARANLDEAMPRVWCESGMGAARSLAASLASGPGAGGGGDRAQTGWPGDTSSAAAGELEAFADWLESERLPRSLDGLALGRGGLREMLRVGEGIDRDPDEMAALGEAGLAADGEAFAAAAAWVAPGLDPGEAWRQVAAAPPPGGDALAIAAGAVEEARRLVVEAGLVTIPAGARLRVAAARRSLAFGVGWLDAPGPYDDPATEAVLYLVPPEEGSVWGPGAPALADLAVTAAYPGRFVWSLHTGRAPGEVVRRFPSRGFEEGWALYAGDLMRAAGYRAGDPRWHLASLHRALVAGCRLLCVASMHCAEMTLDGAQRLFTERAHCAEAEARAEACRCAADPGCLAGALGRWEILGLRRRWEAGRSGATPRAFHDALLSRGAPPLGSLEGVELP